MTSPLLSIIIANYNYGRFLEAAIRSVVEQVMRNEVGGMRDEVEIIICDAASTDNSVEIIKKYANGLPPNTTRSEWCSSSPIPHPPSLISWWCSEKDKGQSDAFNKGFAHARGKYLTWLNADDIMPDGCLKKIVRELERHPDCEWFTGNLYRFTEDGRVVECAWGPNYLPKWLQSRGQPVAVYGPSTIFAKELFDRVGGMKLYQNFMMDTDLWMRFIVAGVKQRRINCFCWAFRMHEESKTAEFGGHKLPAEQRAKFEAEGKQAIVETGYRASRLNHRLIQLWRIFDGSLVMSWWLRKTFRKVEMRSGVTSW